ncbi:YceI family protein [Aridibaculum aurantiacum]|uniref:YceI family protein n=1 Tax=Aridibaculum aurantiacum TaxID=2810307 RepID=UPI001A972A0F|nr:YceI family protein [Aridibaculum aurantiacum]
MKQALLTILIFLLPLSFLAAQGGKVFITNSGKIAFQSDAPYELIKASSNNLSGALDVAKKEFAFKVRVETFEGFNSALQREHFNENYMESNKFPEARFAGKIIEDVNLLQDGHFSVRAKGILTVHGVPQERIIKSDLTIKDGKAHIKSEFTVLLSDHNIPIPKVVKDKLASEIKVEVNCQLQPRQ